MRRKRVEFYEGFKGEELPRKFQCIDKEIRVKEIISSGNIGSTDPEKPIDRFFEVRGEDDKIYKIFYFSEIDQWVVWEKT